ARWDCDDGRPGENLGRQMEGPIVALAVSPDGRHVAVGADHANQAPRPALALFDALTGRQDALALGVRDVTRPARSLAFAPDGRTLAVGRNDGRVAFVHLERQRIIRRVKTGVGVRALAYSPDGRTLVISPATPVLVYDIESDAVRFRLGDPGHAIESLAFCP